MAKLSGPVYVLGNGFLADKDGKRLELPKQEITFAKVDIPAFEINLSDLDVTFTFVCKEPLPLAFKQLFAPYTMTLAERIAAQMWSRVSRN